MMEITRQGVSCLQVGNWPVQPSQRGGRTPLGLPNQGVQRSWQGPHHTPSSLAQNSRPLPSPPHPTLVLESHLLLNTNGLGRLWGHARLLGGLPTASYPARPGHGPTALKTDPPRCHGQAQVSRGPGLRSAQPSGTCFSNTPAGSPGLPQPRQGHGCPHRQAPAVHQVHSCTPLQRSSPSGKGGGLLPGRPSDSGVTEWPVRAGWSLGSGASRWRTERLWGCPLEAKSALQPLRAVHARAFYNKMPGARLPPTEEPKARLGSWGWARAE